VTTERLTLNQAAVHLGCSRSTVRRRIARGELSTERGRHAGGWQTFVLLPAAPQPVAAGTAELEALRAELAEARGQAAALVAQLGTALGLLKAEQQAHHELAHQLAQLRRPGFAQAAGGGSNEQPVSSPREQARPRRWWWRVRWA